jgi:hypothetical protein
MVESMRESTLRCTVLPDGDPLLRERLTKDLYDLLFNEIPVAYPPAADRPGSKGAAVDIATLVVSGTVPVALAKLVALVRTWCERDTRRTVEVTDGERTLRITGNPTKSQLEAIERFIGDQPAATTPDAAP